MNPTLVDQSTEKLEEIRVKREVMMKTSEELYTAIASNFTVFNSKVVDATRNRIDHLIAETVANQKELGAMWEGREKYRLEADKKNASLQFVLGLASEAKQAAYNIENGIEDKGKGKKGAKKK